MRNTIIATLMVLLSLQARAESQDQCTDRCYEELGECEYVCQEKIGCQTKCATSKVKCEKVCTKTSSFTDFNVGYVSRNTIAGYSYASGIRMAASDANLLKSPGFAMRVSAKIHESSAELSSALRAFCTDSSISVVVGGDALPSNSPLALCNKPYVQIGDSSVFSMAKVGSRFQFGPDIRRQILFAAEHFAGISSAKNVAIFVPTAFDNKQFLDELSLAVSRRGSAVLYAFPVGGNGSVGSRKLASGSGEISTIIHMATPDGSSTFLPPQGIPVSGNLTHLIPHDRCLFAAANPPHVCIRPGVNLSSTDGRAFLNRMTNDLRASNYVNDAAFEYAALGFDLGNVLNIVRGKANSADPSSLTSAFREHSSTGISGPISFDSSGIRKTAPVALLEISRNGPRRLK